MDPSKYKKSVVRRGYTYRYYYHPPALGKPTLLFVHGFPSTSYDWRRQVAFFEPKGFGLIVPDCLGYGGASKPTDFREFRWKLLADDLIDIIDAEDTGSVIGIGHDWGSAILSAMVNYHQDRFQTFAWISLSYQPPTTKFFDLDAVCAENLAKTGSERFGYWKFYVQPEAPGICLQHIESFVQIWYAKDPAIWLEAICPTGGQRKWLEENRLPGEASWMSKEEYALDRDTILRDGLESAMSYYKIYVFNGNLADDQDLPGDAYSITKPALFVAAARDYVCLAEEGKDTMRQYASNLNIIEVDTGHWAHLEATEDVNNALLTFFENVIKERKSNMDHDSTETLD